jgi:hypothetical protein
MSIAPRLRRSEVPGYLAQKFGITIAVATLAKLASVGGGPGMQYNGRIPLYPVKELDVWAEGRITPVYASTTERREMSMQEGAA